MKDYLTKDSWKIIEEGYHPEHNKVTESIFSIGNGSMGQRANFEECYTGETMQGSYLAGIYYPDKTRVGWWKNGYPEYFAKVINSLNWIGIDLIIGGEKVDLHQVEILDFYRCLDMQKGLLSKKLKFNCAAGSFTIESTRFCSWTTKELGVISYQLTSEDYAGEIKICNYLDFDVRNQDSNYDEQFWKTEGEDSEGLYPYVAASTKKTGFYVHGAMAVSYDSEATPVVEKEHSRMQAREWSTYKVQAGETIRFTKYAAITSTFNHAQEALPAKADEILAAATDKGYTSLEQEQIEAWSKIWEQGDITIKGDIAAQQGIRFNIFQLKQTYSGHDSRLNIGPKGFTGEKYGGVTYWDTEAYCIPFYLGTAQEEISYNLLKYRYDQLDKAIENAAKLGFKDGAALYPMVTMNGEECHNEWEITFEEIHRNGAIAYAIYDYTRYTGSKSYVLKYGVEVLIAISRFWSQRVNWSEAKQAYVMLGVTGPNEYENNVNNNWYTNYIATWCLRYTIEILREIKESDADHYSKLLAKLSFDENAEQEQWQDIISKMYYPFDAERNVFLQQDGFLDKELIPAAEIPAEEYPIHQNWSWDRILRSCFIKQADVLQGLYFFSDQFDIETIKRNFYFYEPLTVHESSLSPCVHAILAAKLGDRAKAYEMYLRTARLDLDDYNNDTKDGLHITSMGGTWMSVIKGFGGMEVKNGQLAFDPFTPEEWAGFGFTLRYRENIVRLDISESEILLENILGPDITVLLSNEPVTVLSGSTIVTAQAALKTV